MNTKWEKFYLSKYRDFIELILESKPNYIIPIGRKSGKLFDSVMEFLKNEDTKIRYIDYFRLRKPNLDGKRICIVDDSVRTGRSLFTYRNILINELGVNPNNILTFGFIGCNLSVDQILSDKGFKPNIYENQSIAAYYEYLSIQAEHLIIKGSQPDAEYMVIEVEIEVIVNEIIDPFINYLSRFGYIYQLENIYDVDRYGFFCDEIFNTNYILKNINLNIERDFIEKTRFTFLKDKGILYTIPMIFPKIFFEKSHCSLESKIEFDLPFKLPCSLIGEHEYGKICYYSLSLFLSALLARRLILLLREWEPGSKKYKNKITIKKKDLIRYLGDDIGYSFCEDIQKFINCDYSPLDEKIIKNPTIDNIDKSLLHKPIDRNSVPEIIDYLKEGYKEKIETEIQNKGIIEFAKPADALMNIGNGINPFIFSEVISEYCDKGVLVPLTRLEKENECWRRLYRTGEAASDNSWARTKYIIPIAIQEIGENNSIHKMILEKSLTNFIFDYSRNYSKHDDFSELHCLEEEESRWGPQTYAFHDRTKQRIPLDPSGLRKDRKRLEIWKDLSEFFSYSDEKKVYCIKKDLDKIENYFDKNCIVRLEQIIDYFRLLKVFHNESKSLILDVDNYFSNDETVNTSSNIDIVHSLAICRNINCFQRYLLKSIYFWRSDCSNFLVALKDDKKDNMEKHLKNVGSSCKSTRDKIYYLKNFSRTIFLCHEIINKYSEYEYIWEKINNNISIFDEISYEEYRIPTELYEISKLINFHFDLIFALLNLSSGEKKKKLFKRLDDTEDSTYQEIGIDPSIKLNRYQISDGIEIFNVLNNSFKILSSLINEFDPKSLLIKDNNFQKELIKLFGIIFYGKNSNDDNRKIADQIFSESKLMGLDGPHINEKKYLENDNYLLLEVIDSFDMRAKFKIDIPNKIIIRSRLL